MTSRLDVVVLGGGPAGLATAWYASRAGRRVALVERAPHVGGLAASADVAGVRVDHGSHRLHIGTDAQMLADLRGLLGEELQLRRRHGRIRLAGRWLAFPLRPADLLTHAPPGFALRVARDIAVTPWRRRRDTGEDTFAARVRTGLGPTVTDAFYAPYARKLFGLDATELGGELYRRRVGARTGAGVLRRTLSRSSAATFWYPAGGFGRITEAIAGAAREAGATLLLGAPATCVAATPVGATVTVADGTRLDARTVVSTLPATTTTELYGTTDSTVPAGVRAAAAALEYRSTVLVYLVVPRRPYTAFDAHYFPEEHVPLARLSEPANYRDSPADPTDRTVLCAELPGDVREPWWDLDDDVLGSVVRDALVAEGLPDPTPIGVHARRVGHVYPVYRVGHDRHQQTLEAWARTRPELVLLGRQPLFAHDNTHHALAMGRAAATCVGDDGFDHRRWSALRDGFRDHVVED